MADNRSRRAKLQAVINPKSGATAGERENAQRFLDRMGPARAARDTSVDAAVDDFLRKWKPGSSNGPRRGRPIVNVPAGVARSGGITGTLEYGDALPAGAVLTDGCRLTPIE